ncbi:MAG: zinc-ribbon domain-containing protein, partial [Azoarcus sp.]|nr:zinc-ribbon domain-containing protein [Azoarcus sp.]
MLTRCPNCQTVFRLSSEQLLARQGRVRCGTCLHPFNALDHLAESDPKAGQQSNRPPAPPAKPKPSAAPNAPAGQKPAAAKTPSPPAPNAKPAPPPVRTPAPPPAPVMVPSLKTSPKPAISPLLKKTSQRSLSDVDFSSSIDSQSKVPKPPPQWTSSQEFPPLPSSDSTDFQPEQWPPAPNPKSPAADKIVPPVPIPTKAPTTDIWSATTLTGTTARLSTESQLPPLTLYNPPAQNNPPPAAPPPPPPRPAAATKTVTPFPPLDIASASNTPMPAPPVASISNTPLSATFPTEKIFEATMAMPPPEGSPAQIQITRKRGTARKKETAEE